MYIYASRLITVHASSASHQTMGVHRCDGLVSHFPKPLFLLFYFYFCLEKILWEIRLAELTIPVHPGLQKYTVGTSLLNTSAAVTCMGQNLVIVPLVLLVIGAERTCDSASVWSQWGSGIGPISTERP